jgi:hypothetical protein
MLYLICCEIVKALIVSAGENHEIKLPADSITLFAFVLSQPEDAEKGLIYCCCRLLQ